MSISPLKLFTINIKLVLFIIVIFSFRTIHNQGYMRPCSKFESSMSCSKFKFITYTDKLHLSALIVFPIATTKNEIAFLTYESL